MTRRPASLWSQMAMALGAMIATLTGSCTAFIGGVTLPSVLFDTSDPGGYGIAFLWPTLLIGPAFAAGGAFLFRRGHRALVSARPDRIDRLASALTALACLAWSGALVAIVVVTLSDLLAPSPYAREPIWVPILFVAGLAVAPASLAALAAVLAFRRFRAASAARPRVPGKGQTT